MPILQLEVNGGASLDVRTFVIREAISEPFVVSVTALCRDASLDLSAIVGRPASFHVVTGLAFAESNGRTWKGICRFAELERPASIPILRTARERSATNSLSTYRFDIVPELWLLTQRRDHRIFQHLSAPSIALRVLDRFSVHADLAVDASAHPTLPFKVQYAESDYAFFCRILEEAGIAFTYPESAQKGSVLTLSDALQAGEARTTPMVYVASPNESAEQEFVSDVRLSDDARPGAYTLGDYDLRQPKEALRAEAEKAAAPEDRLEQYHYRPGSFLVETETPPDSQTPAADDQGASRHDANEGKRRADRGLQAERVTKRVVSFRTNVLDLWPGRVFTLTGHPHPDLSAQKRLLVTELSLEGGPGVDWTVVGRAVFTDTPYRPKIRTPRPRARIQSATVAASQSVYTDEFGRVRVQFPWDRESTGGAGSSCWVRVNQGWAGAGYGMMVLPRWGQEVLVDFIDGDPEQPVIVGRLFNQTNAVPHTLPEHATRSAWKSDSSPGGGGFSEVVYEDKKGSELLFAQAQQDARRLVKHDDTSTVGHNRQKEVCGEELETTNGSRTQVTDRDRLELTDEDRTTAIEQARRDRVFGQAFDRIAFEQQLRVAKDRHVVSAGDRVELVEQHAHLKIDGARPESVGSTDSLTVGKALQESVGSYTVMATGPKGWIHLIAGVEMVIDSATEVTVKGAKGFIKIGGGAVTIVGSEVVINDGGSPASLPGPGAKRPEQPRVALVYEPEAPPVDVVSHDVDLR